jgi:signal transduction histidine kinase
MDRDVARRLGRLIETAAPVDVSDTCAGLSPEQLRTIFEPFKRGRSAKGRTGLRLAIARRAVEARGGSIRGESSGTAGCSFWTTVPKRRVCPCHADDRPRS